MASNGMFDISYVIDILYYIGIDDYWGIGVMIWQYSAFHSIVRVIVSCYFKFNGGISIIF